MLVFLEQRCGLTDGGSPELRRLPVSVRPKTRTSLVWNSEAERVEWIVCRNPPSLMIILHLNAFFQSSFSSPAANVPLKARTHQRSAIFDDYCIYRPLEGAAASPSISMSSLISGSSGSEISTGASKRISHTVFVNYSTRMNIYSYSPAPVFLDKYVFGIAATIVKTYAISSV